MSSTKRSRSKRSKSKRSKSKRKKSRRSSSRDLDRKHDSKRSSSKRSSSGGKKKKSMYCGNNRRHLSIRRGEKRIGTRYECFQRGVGIGLNLPYDASFATRYVPIHKVKVYCGKAGRTPQGYDISGTNSMCMTKGVGVGRNIKAKKHRKFKPRKK